MTKQDYDRIKNKEAQIEHLLKSKNIVESSKILQLKLRYFNEDKTEFEDIVLTDLPKGKIKGILLENFKIRLENAQNDYEEYFNGETIFPEPSEKTIAPWKI